MLTRRVTHRAVNFESVLIITYGRSGSTLLQGLLNSIAGCVVRGENHNLCYGLFLAYQSLQKTKQQYGKDKASLLVTSPWFGAALLDEQRFLDDARTLVWRQFVPDGEKAGLQCIGFKEIRYLPEHFDKGVLQYYLDFLAKLFPNPAFIFLTRNHDQVARSEWWKSKDPKQVEQTLKAFEANIADYSKGKEFVFLIDYQDMKNQTPNLKQLFDFLGAPYIEDKIAHVLTARHGYSSEEGVLRKGHKCTIEPTLPSELVYFSVDPFANPLNANDRITLGGVAVLAPAEQGKYRLIATDLSGEHPVLWGLPSPAIGKKYRDISGAGTCRFKIEGLRLVQGEGAELHLVADHGGRQRLARINIRTSEQ